MKRILHALLFSSMVGCGGSPSSNSSSAPITFAPQKSETKVDYRPTTTQEQNTLSTGVKISVMVPTDFTQANQSLVQSKLLQVVSRGGISGVGGSPTIVIAPIFALLSESVTATVPPKTMLKYSVTLYVANIITGDAYGSTTIEVMGVGDSAELALQNAISSISISDSNILQMISESSQRIAQQIQKRCCL
ncbi:MAG: hypothetical protein R3Y04_00125 [Rikenellaceae bacterium]